MQKKIPADEFTSPVIAKGHRYVATRCTKIDGRSPEVVWVQGSVERPYRVQVTDIGAGHEPLVSCTCEYGMLAGAGGCRCSHAYAALEVLKKLV